MQESREVELRDPSPKKSGGTPPSSPKTPEYKITEKNWTQLLEQLPTEYPERIHTIDLDNAEEKSTSDTVKFSILLKGCFGSGDENQKRVADLDDIAAKKHQVQLGLMLGDYRYAKKGAYSRVNYFVKNIAFLDAGGFTWAGDPHIKEYITDIYQNPQLQHLSKVKFLGAMGNHEYGKCKHGETGVKS